MEYEDDCENQVIILNSPMNMKHGNCAVYTDPLVDFQAYTGEAIFI